MTIRRWPIVLCLLLLGLAAYPAAAQTNQQDVTLQVEPFFDGHYRAGYWLPLRITVANDGADMTAVINVDTGPIWQTQVDLPRGANKSFVLYTQPTTGFRRTITARVLLEETEVAKTEVPITGVTGAVQMIGVLSTQPLTLPQPVDDKGPQQAEIIAISRDALPSRNEGLAMFTALIVDGAPLADLSVEQQQALSDWVSNGGSLVLGGDQLGTTLEQLPETLRVAAPGNAVEAAPISLLPEIGDVLIDAIAVIGNDEARTIATSGAITTAVQAAVGSGTVTVFGWSLSDPRLTALPTGATIWQSIARFQTPNTAMGMPPAAEMQAQQLSFALTQLPVLAMPPLGVLAGLLAVYLFVIGPGMYLVLRRLDRQAWAWVAIPVVTIVFSLGAYGYGLQLRGNDIILNQISVMESSGDRSHVRTFAGLFSPRTAEYRITGGNNALFKPMVGGEWGPMPAVSSGGVYTQGVNGVDNFEVSQWSMNTFAAEQMLDGSPLKASLQLVGDKLQGTIQNTGTVPVMDVALVQNMRTTTVGNLQPGERRDVSLDLGEDVPVAWGGSVSMMLLRDKWDFSKPIQPPTEVRQRMMVLDALFSSPYDRTTAPMLIGWLEQSPIDLSVNVGRVQSEQVTIVTSQVEPAITSDGSITIPRGWIKPEFQISSEQGGMGGGPCMTQFGSGWYLDTGAITTTLQLPPVAHGLQVNKATLFVQKDGPPADAPLLSLYDWSTGEWVQQQPDQLTLEIQQPERFINELGVLQARVEITGGPGKGGACLSTDLAVEGTQS